MEPLYEEYLTDDGTIVKPYFWLSFSLDCTNCPYHIRTGEEARVPYTEFQRIFGFPWSTYPQIKHLTFYELRSSSWNLIQKGHASNCTGNLSHPESMLFEKNGYLDSVISYNSNIRHIILYSNHSPCNEASHYCISKMYTFLMMYPDITLNIFFSQLYHTENQFPTSARNREALRSLASLWPQVTLNPISGDIWHCILENFVSCVPGVLQPFTSGRILVDRYNAYEINSITGVKPYFINVLLRQERERQSRKVWATLENYPLNNADPGQAKLSQGPSTSVVSMLVPYRELPPILVSQNPQKPRNVVRHLNMPQLSSSKAKDLRESLSGKPMTASHRWVWRQQRGK
ncbi:putative C-_U-editing enzyme APOBEC-4 [Cricetulus griseus]|uniref:Apolipoprotein B mRNA editing enzyme catalytic polypeptide-like 4 n=1 Tax=Cricetulus griseus TaxID=10029 RepID=A0A8C2QD88_CRIGR|nr:putative C->U-editing enzyme APOBEC-4 [Cricetulus griseus]XP_035312037.1 putative C->U-editing enzyme APOBEC-4 [Cricetulus griseus]ERE73614.1 putative C->U-editing enzyme APOBEC-4 [Cricetulus griseus]